MLVVGAMFFRRGYQRCTSEAVMRGFLRYSSTFLLASGALLGCSSASTEDEPVASAQQNLATANSFWRLNDCAATSTILADSSGSGISATRASGASCSTRPNGASAVAFDAQGEN